jgi:protein arginine kinase
MIVARKLDLGRGWFLSSGADSDVVICSRIRLGRNFAGYPFVDRLVEEDRNDLSQQFLRVIDGHSDIFSHFPAELSGEPDELARQALLERCLIEQTPLSPRALFVQEDLNLALSLFDDDHLRIVSMRSGRALRETLCDAQELEAYIDREMPFAVSLHWGYVGPDPQQSGAGMSASVLVHLPALMDGPDSHEAFVSVLEPGVRIKAFRSESSHSLANVYQLEAGRRPGHNEDQIIAELEESAGRLVHYERQARNRLAETRRDETQSSVQRALGLLRTTSAIRADEALQLLSWIRLGVALGLADEISMEEVTTLMFLSQKSHLMQTTGRRDDEDDRRAHLLRRGLSTDG